MTDTCTRCSSRLVYGVCLRCSAEHSARLADSIPPDEAHKIPIQETLDAVTYAMTKPAAPASEGAVGTPREPWRAGKVLFDEFEVVRELGRGGMGVVYLVESRLSGQTHAVKRTRVVDPTAREALLSEVQTWKDLPEHPNLTACHFFRTLGDDVVIFAEHVDGGGLDDAVTDGAGWPARRRFELAIQFATGLEAAHIAGYVHQDVKPGNALVSTDGTLKVTDFGLARTQQLLASGSGPAGLTPAFCSPEQAFRDQPITASTDLWSWAVSVMFLFFGRMRWETGIFAPGVLELHRNGKLGEIDCAIPDRLAGILEACFAVDVDERWVNSSALCNALENAWHAEYGEEWARPRLAPVSVKRGESTRIRTDPRRWLDAEHAELEQLGDIGQLALYDRAARKVSAGIESGEFGPGELGELLLEKGRLHHRTYDWPGALDAFRHARRLLETDIGQAEVSAGEARVLTEIRRFDEAEEAYLRARELFERAGVEDDRLTALLLDISENRWLANDHASAQEHLSALESATTDRDDEAGREFRARLEGLCGNVALQLGRFADAPLHYRAAGELYEDLILLDGREDLRWRLCTAYFNLATGLTFGRRHDEALRYFRRSERGLERLVEQPAGKRWSATLAQCLTNFGMCLRRTGQLDGARQKLERAVRTFERVVHLEGRRDVEDYLTTAYLNLATVMGAQGHDAEAAALCERVVRIRRRKVDDEGRDDVRDRLAAVLGNWAYYLVQSDQNTLAITAYDESVDIRESLLDEGNDAVVRGLARQLLNRAELHEALGLWDAMRADAVRAEEVLRQGGDDGTRVEAGQMLALAWHRAGDDELALAALQEVERSLIALAEETPDARHLAEYQVRALALQVLCGERDAESAAEAIANHRHAADDERTSALQLLVRWAIERSHDSTIDLVERALLCSPDLAGVARIELDAAKAVATGRSSDIGDRVLELARRTGRYWLGELATRLST